MLPKYTEDYEGYKCYFWFLCSRLDSIKALSHTAYKITNDLLPLNDARDNAKILILIIFTLTFIFSYLFGKELINRNFGIIIAVITTSDLYFNALNRSFGIIPIAIHPLLFYLSFFFLLKLTNCKEYKKFFFGFMLGVAISLNIFNGYPNTSIILNLVIILYLFFFFLGSNLKLFKKVFPIRIIDMFVVFLSACLSLFFLSSIYGIYVRGDSIFYFLSNLDTRIINFIDYWHWRKHVAQIEPDYINNFLTSLKSLYIPNIYQFHVHEQLFVFHLDFINNFEKIFLALSIPLIFYKIKIYKVSFYFFLPLLMIFIVFMTVFESNLSISRGNYHFYSLAYIFISFSIYKFSKIIFLYREIFLDKSNIFLTNFLYSVKYFSKISTNNNSSTKFVKKINLNVIILVIILPIAFQNLYQLNKNFIRDYQSNLSGFFGLNEINNFFEEEKLSEDDLVFFDFKRQSPINIQRLNNYNDDYKFEFFSYFEKYFENLDNINDFLKEGNIYVVKKVTSKISKITNTEHELMFITSPDLLNIFPMTSPVKIIKNYDKSIAYIIYKFKKDSIYKITSEKYLSNIDLKELNNIVIKNPGPNFTISCDNKHKNFYINGIDNIDYYVIDLENKDLIIHSNLNLKSYESVNLKNEKNPLIDTSNPINKLFLNDYANTFFYNKKSEGSLSKSINSSEKIKNMNLSVTTILFNDRLKRNKIFFEIENKSSLFSKKIFFHKSNQTNSYDLFRYIGPEGNLIGDIIKYNTINIDIKNSNKINTFFKVRNYSNEKSGFLYFEDKNDISKYNYMRLSLEFDFKDAHYCEKLSYEGVGKVYTTYSY